MAVKEIIISPYNPLPIGGGSFNEIVITPYNPLKVVGNAAYAITKQYIIQAVGTEFYKAGMPQALQADDRQLGVGQSLGNKVFSNLEVQADEYELDGKRFQFQDLIFDTCLFVVTQTKNIVKTPIQGRSGTVKEFIGNGDYNISIKGVISGAKDRYPLNGNSVNNANVNSVNNLIVMGNAPIELSLNSWYLNMIGIYKIVIESFNLPQRDGSYSTQFFEIEAVSDTDFIVDLNR